MKAETNLRLLSQIPYFLGVPAKELARVEEALRLRRYRRGEVIFHKGDECEGLNIVLEGRVQTVITSAEGRQQVLKVFAPGRTFGDISVFDGERHPAQAVAQSDAVIAVLPRADLFDLLKRHPDAAMEVVRLFAGRLRAYKQMVEDLSLRSVTARVARLLIDRAYGKTTLVEDAANASLEHTQDEMAAMVGSVREVVQRALKALEHAELIEIERGRIHIIDVEALAAWTT